MTRRPVRSRLVAGREVVAVGIRRSTWRDAYHTLLTMPWRRFFALVFAGYLALNFLFAAGYHALSDAIENADGTYADAFFFSVQTLATIGYGKMAPRTFGANVLVTIEALLGMVGLAVTTGLVFARFSRPTARILFSRVAVVGPYDGRPALQLRMANARGNEIVEARLKLTLIRDEVTAEGHPVRRLHDLVLVRSEHYAFGFTWTAVHPITPGTPLHGWSPDALRRTKSNVMVSLTGIDEGLSQTIHARHAYSIDDLVWNARFADILSTRDDRIYVDYRNFHETVPLDAAAERAPAGEQAAPAVRPDRRAGGP